MSRFLFVSRRLHEINNTTKKIVFMQFGIRLILEIENKLLYTAMINMHAGDTTSKSCYKTILIFSM